MAQGSIQKLKTGYRLRIELPIDPESGKRRWHSEMLPTKRRAEERRVEILASLAENRYSRMAKLPLATFLTETWLPYYRTRVRQSSYVNAEQHVRLHINPYLGSLRMDSLKPLDILGWHGTLEKRLSPVSIQVIHSTLNKALAQAVKWEVLNRNPATRSTPKAAPIRKQTLWDDEQLRVLLDHLRNDSQLYTLVCLLAATGMRRGEALALQWDDLDLDDGTLQVQRTLTRTVDLVWVMGDPKSATSRRFIGLAPEIVALLKAQQEAQAARRARSYGWHDTGLVFDRGDGNLYTPSAFDWWWRKAIRTSGVPHMRIHDLRHAAATRLLERGVALKVVSHQLGHSNIGITANTYQHVTRPLINDAANVLGEFLRERDTNVTADKM